MSKHGLALGDEAENLMMPRALEQSARVRAAALLKQCSRLAETEPWMKGAAEHFLLNDEAEFRMETNQGQFVVIVKPG